MAKIKLMGNVIIALIRLVISVILASKTWQNLKKKGNRRGKFCRQNLYGNRRQSLPVNEQAQTRGLVVYCDGSSDEEVLVIAKLCGGIEWFTPVDRQDLGKSARGYSGKPPLSPSSNHHICATLSSLVPRISRAMNLRLNSKAAIGSTLIVRSCSKPMIGKEQWHMYLPLGNFSIGPTETVNSDTTPSKRM